jgi:ectoine hydroxylase-related dioxygenase (phytanoyl-CoA dioxygenase family)
MNMNRLPNDRYRVTAEQYRAFRRDGYLVVFGLVPADDVEELRRHTDDLMQGRLPEQRSEMSARDVARDSGVTVQHLEAPPAHLSPVEQAQHYLRIHMLHRKLALHERYLLHPRVLDVLEVLIGPDVLALQTMLFLKPPGKPGQGWHQDSYYIPTHPDSLCGAWLAIDDADEANGAMSFARGSHVEPVYPPCPDGTYGFGDRLVSDVTHVRGASEDDSINALVPIAARYEPVLVPARAGDVVFFGGHVLHMSRANRTADRFRRAFVGHYCNARSFTQWGADGDRDDVHASHVVDPVTKMTNGSHILARGDTHLPFAQPRFGTPCAALLPPEQRRCEYDRVARIIASANDGLLGCATT